ncbi:sensor histidine kinase [Qipengyuania marisflavi]|uniref:histidine kinase n=1 Tax=Qipengyuania marisflavi TaxID=2486356 RepID=A0A5S3P6Y9_9SPHN|nr:histidine kinase dimerization/phospho-acceptor domain-containing protein [Qipengyuania marisflavi]TMM49008.1 sensor histidine kinase [Qipengyuania marisflavi]
MHFDDRLATVLRHRAAGERAARTQFRQLIDLLGERPQAGDRSLKAAAYLRLIALGEMIPVESRAALVAESGWRFRNPDLVKWFGSAAPAVAAGALYRAHLTGTEWQDLIPKLPIRARGFLRHRRDLPDEAVQMLDRLGVQDRALPMPDILELGEDAVLDSPEAEKPAPLAEATEPEPFALSPANDADEPLAEPASENPSGIRALVERIDAFQRHRGERTPAGDAPSLPLAELHQPAERKELASFAFGTDSQGKIDWAEPEIAPMVTGLDLAAVHTAPDTAEDVAAAFLNRQPLRDLPIQLRGAARITGDWVVDAAPRFTRIEGRFQGYVGRFRRAVSGSEDTVQAAADRLRQLLHELRTPVNAMQGYAEVIQQQLFGPTPHEYRALAAAIAGDSARILAGFDELDRLARLESGDLDLDPGEADFAAIARTQVEQLQSVLSPRVARFDASFGEDRAPLALAQAEAEVLAWRLLATLAGAIGAGEAVKLAFEVENGQLALRAQLPASLKAAADIFSTETRVGGGTLSAGIFGAGFSLRLARAETRAAGGDLARVDDWLVLSLPLLTPADSLPSPMGQPDRAAG